MMIENSILALVEREKVRDVIVAYCMALDEGNLVRVAECFSEDAVADYGPGRGGVRCGAAAIVERIAIGQSPFLRTHHQLGQMQVVLAEEGAAVAVSYVTAWHQRHTGEKEIACLRYIDSLRRDDYRWTIHSRRVEASFVDGFPGTTWDWVKRERRSPD
jgi:ketosteroid isomerase-like protein